MDHHWTFSFSGKNCMETFCHLLYVCLPYSKMLTLSSLVDNVLLSTRAKCCSCHIAKCWWHTVTCYHTIYMYIYRYIHTYIYLCHNPCNYKRLRWRDLFIQTNNHRNGGSCRAKSKLEQMQRPGSYIQETSVSRHHGSPIEVPLKPHEYHGNMEPRG